jgi:hypothetical protein
MAGEWQLAVGLRPNCLGLGVRDRREGWVFKQKLWRTAHRSRTITELLKEDK